jgi:hypothetical protein
MRISIAAAISLAVITSGCQTTAQQNAEADPIGWFTFDCKRPSQYPEVEAEFERAKLICGGRAEAAAIAGTAHIRPGYSMGSAIVAGIESGQKQAQISTATASSCMAELGFRMSKRSEFEVLCPAPPPKAPGKSKKPTVS